MYSVKWVQVNGCKYSIGSIVVIETSITPTFGLIIDLIIAEVEKCMLVCEVLNTDKFVEHFHAFCVKREATTATPLAILTPYELSDYHVLSLYKEQISMYVVPKYSLHV